MNDLGILALLLDAEFSTQNVTRLSAGTNLRGGSNIRTQFLIWVLISGENSILGEKKIKKKQIKFEQSKFDLTVFPTGCLPVICPGQSGGNLTL